MQFEPKTREQAEKESQFPVWNAGNYDFEIAKADAQTSKKGNEMIKLTLNVYNDVGESQMVFDYLMPAFPVKLIDACEAMGLMQEYDSGTLEPYKLEGKKGTLRLAIKPKSTNKKTGEEYPERNEVNTYIVGLAPAKQSQASAPFTPGTDKAANLDDEIPF